MPICFPSFGRAVARHAETLEASGMPEASGLNGKPYLRQCRLEWRAGPATPAARAAENAALETAAGRALVAAGPIV
jgi:hypothetical protein